MEIKFDKEIVANTRRKVNIRTLEFIDEFTTNVVENNQDLYIALLCLFYGTGYSELENNNLFDSDMRTFVKRLCCSRNGVEEWSEMSFYGKIINGVLTNFPFTFYDMLESEYIPAKDMFDASHEVLTYILPMYKYKRYMKMLKSYKNA